MSIDVVINETDPMSDIMANGSVAFAYDADGNLETITKTINGVDYEKTLTWTNGSCTAISAWSKA